MTLAFFCLAAVVCLALAADIGRGFTSDCLDPAFEMRYSDMSKRAMLNFGVTILLDYRFTEKVTREQLQLALDTTNGLYRGARVRLVDLRVETLAAEFAPDVSQQGSWARESEVRWRAAAAPFLGQGRIVIVMAQAKSINGGAFIEGKLLGPQPLNATGVAEGVAPLLWVNVDPDQTDAPPYFNTWTFAHEVGHRFGLLHTFETRFGCDVGDAVSDTDAASARSGDCDEGGLDSCRVERQFLDYSNYMSYGRCSTGVKFTPGQLRRVRCVVENHLRDLVVLPDSSVADLPVVTPTAPPTSAPTVSSVSTSTVQSSTTATGTVRIQRCNGIRGSCIDTTRSRCADQLIPGRCSGSSTIQCCPSERAPFVTPLPGVGTACISIEGVCQDIEDPFTKPCSTGYVAGKCAGPRQVQCCPTAGSIPPSGPSIDIDSGSQVEFVDTILYPIGYTIHVGAQLWAPVTTSLNNVVAFFVPSSTVRKPTKDDLFDRELPVFFNRNPNGAIARIATFKSGNFIDRGDYLLVVTGLDESGAARQFISTIITVDVNSCPVDVIQYNVPYGLIRTAAACAARQGTPAASTSVNIPAGMVCCVAAMVESGFTARPSVDGSSPPLALRVAWRGLTSFWGAPMTIALRSAPDNNDVPLLLMSTSTPVQAMPEPTWTLSGTNGGIATATPAVGTAGVYALADASGQFTSTSISIVSLPCRLSSGLAGYCMPRQPIVDGAFGTTPATSVCAGGDLAPCAALRVGNIQFACCIAAASALQKQASYLQSLDGDDDEPSGATTTTTNASSVVAIVLVAAASLLALKD